MADKMRVAIPEDLDFDPAHRRQLRVARFLLGIALNRYPAKPDVRLHRDTEPTRAQLVELALETGLVFYDDFHHAPMCPANNWSRQQLPEGPCTCGAERHKIMSGRRDAR